MRPDHMRLKDCGRNESIVAVKNDNMRGAFAMLHMTQDFRPVTLWWIAA